MNSCEDQTEPLGEAPELPTDTSDSELVGWARVGVACERTTNKADFEAEFKRIENADKAIRELRALHIPDGEFCYGCDAAHPCLTIRVLEKWGV